MPRLRILSALIKKEGIQILKDPSSLIAAFVLPFLLLILYASGASLDMDHLAVGVVVEKPDPISRDLAGAFAASRFLGVSLYRDRQEMRRLMDSGQIHGFVVIPARFSADLADPNKTAKIQVIADGSSPNTARFVSAYVNGVAAAWQGGAHPPSVIVDARMWYNEDVNSHWFLIPGSIVIVLTIVGALLSALVVAREWEKGTMEALMATPVSMTEILLSKFLTYLLMSMGSLLVCLFIAHGIYGVPFRGSVAALTLCSLAYMAFAVQMGLLISSITRNQFAASQATVIATFLPAFILSGFIFDIASMPLPLRIISLLVVARYYVTCLKTLFLVGDIWSVLLPNLIVLLCAGALLAYLVLRRSVKRLDA